MIKQAPARTQTGQGTAQPARRNITDPDSRLMPVRGGGFIQGYNAQNVASSDGLIIATRLTSDTTDTTDTRWYEPMISAAAAVTAGPDSEQIGLVLADAGYLSEHNLTCDGPDRLIATGKRRDLERRARQATGADAGHDPGGVIAAMAASPPKRASPPTGSAAASPRPPTAASSTTCGCASYRSAESAKQQANGHSPAPPAT